MDTCYYDSGINTINPTGGGYNSSFTLNLHLYQTIVQEVHKVWVQFKQLATLDQYLIERTCKKSCSFSLNSASARFDSFNFLIRISERNVYSTKPHYL